MALLFLSLRLLLGRKFAELPGTGRPLLSENYSVSQFLAEDILRLLNHLLVKARCDDVVRDPCEERSVHRLSSGMQHFPGLRMKDLDLDAFCYHVTSTSVQ